MHQDKSSFDFFSKNSTTAINESSSKTVKMWGMALYTFYQVFNLFFANYKKILITAILFGVATAIVPKISGLASEKQTRRMTLKENKIAMIRAIDSTEFAKVLQHIQNQKNTNLNALKTGYWNAKFINDHTTSLNMNSITRDTREMAQRVSRFYDKRLNEMTETYILIQKNQINLIKDTHDDENSIDVLLDCINSTQAGTLTVHKKISDESNRWMRYLEDPIALKNYMTKNAAIIESIPVF